MWANLNLWHVLWFVILGGFVGWLAGLAFPRHGLRLWGYVAVGVIGAVAVGVLGALDGQAGDPHLKAVGLFFYGCFLCFAMLGGLVGWLVGRALLGSGRVGNVYLGAIGAVESGLFFLYFVLDFYPPVSFVAAFVGAVLCLAFVIILARRRRQ